jgi:hypothetical protein
VSISSFRQEVQGAHHDRLPTETSVYLSRALPTMHSLRIWFVTKLVLVSRLAVLTCLHLSPT